MNVFRRKNKWQRVAGKAATMTAKSVVKPAVRTGVSAVTGAVAIVAASAAVTSRRKKNQS